MGKRKQNFKEYSHNKRKQNLGLLQYDSDPNESSNELDKSDDESSVASDRALRSDHLGVCSDNQRTSITEGI